MLKGFMTQFLSLFTPKWLSLSERTVHPLSLPGSSDAIALHLISVVLLEPAI